ncbi:MAG: hypothetical protein U5K32_09095 [Bacteroidales bacterium]|nr:hypothetical protein [Bacteroidales bacterium]
MKSLLFIITMLLFLSIRTDASVTVQETAIDTAAINSQTRQAYMVARRNPDLAIRDAHQALSVSSDMEYKKEWPMHTWLWEWHFLPGMMPATAQHIIIWKLLIFIMR